MGGKKRNHSSQRKKAKKAALEKPIEPEELDRFAGSSDEEADNKGVHRGGEDSDSDDSDSGNDGGGDKKIAKKNAPKSAKLPSPKSAAKKESATKKKSPKPSKASKKGGAMEDDDEDAQGDKEHDSDKDLEKSSDDDSSDDDDDDEEFDQYENQKRRKLDGAAGMADAMAKILGTTTSTAITTTTASSSKSPEKHYKKSKAQQSQSVVLSKTTTPLQRMQQKEKEEAKLLREKRRHKEKNPLPALHIPLSVATTLTVPGIDNNKSVAQELELERLHRRVATRGVVALFNAVAQHQNKKEEPSSSLAQRQSAEQVKKMTKHGFLDMIKNAAASKSGGGTAVAAAAKSPREPETSKWAALEDDYMMNPKKVRVYKTSQKCIFIYPHIEPTSYCLFLLDNLSSWRIGTKRTNLRRKEIQI